MINPIRQKGGEILVKLAEYFPDREFLAVLAWADPLCTGIDLSLYPNITFLYHQIDMRVVYAQSRLVIVPTQEPEPLGRVPYEAACNNIPTVVSDIGGVRDFDCGNSLFIEDYTNIQAWINAILYFDDSSNYQRHADCCSRLTGRYSLDTQVTRFEEICSHLLGN